MIHVDRTDNSAVAVCTRCSWRDVFTHVNAAYRASADHAAGHSAKDAARIREKHARIIARNNANTGPKSGRSSGP